FFSSRRRHTRFSRDWSSDVCSSDLFSSISVYPSTPVSGDNINITGIIKNIGSNNALSYNAEIYNDLNFDSTGSPNELIFSQSFKIGRASCRERVYIYFVWVSVQEKD